MQDWLKDKANLYPERVVITEGEKRYTYYELSHQADQLVGALEDQVQPGDRVAVLSLNSVWEIVLAFATWRLGACLVPYNYRLSDEELKRVIADSSPAVTIFDGDNDGRVEGISFDQLLEKRKYPTVDRYFGKDDPALILYTSGTTGHPKGAILSHKMILANCEQTLRGWELNHTDKTLLYAPLFHTGGWNVLTLPLLCGGGHTTLMNTFDAAKVVDYINQGQVTVLFGVPTMFEMILGKWEVSQEKVDKIRFFISGGAPCPHELIHKYLDLGINFRQGFGMTEVGPNCFYFPGEAVKRKMGTVGKAMTGTNVKIIPDEEGDSMGELAIGGSHVFSGYWNNSEATSNTLVDGFVRTGDLAHIDEDGFYTIVGRRKEMYISGGENVFPIEIERELHGHSGVEVASVIGVPHEKWGEVGAAFIVVSDRELTGDRLKEYLRERLAHYKVPKHFHLVDELPRNSMGKVLKKELSKLHGEMAPPA